jgi:predicted N-acetyltransferase YhbS
MQPADSPAVARLVESNPHRGEAFDLTTHFLIEPYRAYHLLRANMLGVVAEPPGTREVVGMATVAFDHYMIEGRRTDVALLGNLKVRHDYRHQGLGTKLAEWRIAAARDLCGDDIVILSGTTTDNMASRATMRKWGAQFVGPLVVVPIAASATAPPPLPGVTVRPAAEYELTTIARQINDFYAGYSIHPVYPPHILSEMLTTTVYDYRIAVDESGNILAGVLVCNRAALMVDKFRGSSPFLPDDTLRTAELGAFWYIDLPAARHLWQSIRWEFNARVNVFSVVFDPRGSLNDVFQVAPNTPKFELIASCSAPLNPTKPVSLGVRS